MGAKKKNDSAQNNTKPAWIKFLAVVIAALIGGTVTLIVDRPELFKKHSPLDGEVSIRMYNTDDIAEIYVNDSLIDIFEATEDNPVYEENITKELKTGNDEIKYIIKNKTGGWAFSFELLKDGYIYYSRSYGTKYNYRGKTIGNLKKNKLVEYHGADNNNIDDVGVVFCDSINIHK